MQGRHVVALTLFFALHTIISAGYDSESNRNDTYVIARSMMGKDFFSNFIFFTAPDPTHGYVSFVDQNTALAEGLVWSNSSYVYIGVDYSSVARTGRKSVRVESNFILNKGLYIMDISHMPEGCGTWPAWWLVGGDWPTGGEIDIIEGMNNNTAVLTTLHTNQYCSMKNETNIFTGSWTPVYGENATDCWINAPAQYSNQGCAITGPVGSFGSAFNSQGGGVFALEWTEAYIQTFFFQRGYEPASLLFSPNTSEWGIPYAYYRLGENCHESHFVDLIMILQTTFCGDWAGTSFESQCPETGSCSTYVQDNPPHFADAYWGINYINIFQKGNKSVISPRTFSTNQASGRIAPCPLGGYSWMLLIAVSFSLCNIIWTWIT